jgi:hypothetical protein
MQGHCYSLNPCHRGAKSTAEELALSLAQRALRCTSWGDQAKSLRGDQRLTSDQSSGRAGADPPVCALVLVTS